MALRLVTLTVMLLGLTGRAAAQRQGSVRAAIQRADRQWQTQDYRAVIETLQRVVGEPTATRDQRALAWEKIGSAWLILGNEDQARQAFEDLLALDPGYALTDESRSPKLLEFFDRVRASFVPGYARSSGGRAELELTAPSAATAGAPLEVAVSVKSGAERVGTVTLFSRRQGQVRFDAQPLGREGVQWFAAIVPPRDAANYPLEYYLEARDGDGHVLGRVASPEQPMVLAVHGTVIEVAPPRPRRRALWLAVGLGAVGVVAGGLALTLSLTLPHAPPTTTLGTVTVAP